jgi:hypothetical protein
MNLKRMLFLPWLSLLLLPAAFAQAPPMGSIRVQCVKARPGKEAELRTFLMDASAKLGKLRVDSGAYSSFVIAQAVAPIGRAARCDFHLVAGTSGLPLETQRVTDEDLKKAGI